MDVTLKIQDICSPLLNFQSFDRVITCCMTLHVTDMHKTGNVRVKVVLRRVRVNILAVEICSYYIF